MAGVSGVVSSVGSEDSAAMTGVVVSTAVPSTVVGASTALSSAAGSGVFSLGAVALGLKRFPNPDRLLRFSFFSVAAMVRRER